MCNVRRVAFRSVVVIVFVAVARAAAKVEKGRSGKERAWQQTLSPSLPVALAIFIVKSQVVWANSNRHLLPHVVTVAALNVQPASGAFHFYCEPPAFTTTHWVAPLACTTISTFSHISWLHTTSRDFTPFYAVRLPRAPFALFSLVVKMPNSFSAYKLYHTHTHALADFILPAVPDWHL